MSFIQVEDEFLSLKCLTRIEIFEDWRDGSIYTRFYYGDEIMASIKHETRSNAKDYIYRKLGKLVLDN